MGLLLKKTFPLYAVQVGEHVHVTRQVEQGRQWQRDARKEKKATAYKICKSWEEVKAFRQKVLTPVFVEKYRENMQKMMFEAMGGSLEKTDEPESEEESEDQDFFDIEDFFHFVRNVSSQF